MDGIFFGRNRNNLVALYPYSQALRKGSKSSAIYWIKEIGKKSTYGTNSQSSFSIFDKFN